MFLNQYSEIKINNMAYKDYLIKQQQRGYDVPKVKVELNFFKVIDSELIAYTLGTISRTRDMNNIKLKLLIEWSNDYESSIIEDIKCHLGTDLSYKPIIDNEFLKHSFLRGYIESGDIQHTEPYELQFGDEKINNYSGCVDLYGKLYKNATVYSQDCKDFIMKIIKKNNDSIINYILLSDMAVPPYKKNLSDAGWDLTIVKKIKQDNNLYYYTTDLSVQSDGYWFKIIPRSSLCKKGWGLANSVGIIDSGYTGPINICLFKIDPNAEELTLPCRCIQMIPEKLVILECAEIQNSSITDRGTAGGLGDSIFN